MATPGVTARPYGSQQRCPVARTLDVVGDRWTILVLRELAFGPRRFGELERNLGGIPPAVLTSRLQRLEGAALVERRRTLAISLSGSQYGTRSSFKPAVHSSGG